MEKILFSSEVIDLSFNFSDHSISSDEELLPINCYKTNEKPINSEINCEPNGSKYDQKCDSNAITSMNSGHLLKKKEREKDTNSDVCDKSNKIGYYKECPLCKSFGPKSINHIKQCANKRSIDPKQVLQLLTNCQKADQKSINCPKSKPNAKQNKRSNKLMDNYVITFGVEKRLEISINPKLISDKNTKIKENKFELSSLDPKERQRRLMVKINEQISEDFSKTNDKNNISINSLPTIWRLSLLDSNPDHYFVNGFEKYDKILI